MTLTFHPGRVSLHDLERVNRDGVAVRLDPGCDAAIARGAARIAAKTLADLVGGRGKVGDIGITAGSQTGREREQGFLDGMKQYPDIEVLPVSIYDDELRQKIARAIYGNSAFWRYAAMVNPPIHIIVERGRVTLTGVVGSEVDRALARSLATGRGELSVANELRTDAEVSEARRATASLAESRIR